MRMEVKRKSFTTFTFSHCKWDKVKQNKWIYEESTKTDKNELI